MDTTRASSCRRRGSIWNTCGCAFSLLFLPVTPSNTRVFLGARMGNQGRRGRAINRIRNPASPDNEYNEGSADQSISINEDDGNHVNEVLWSFGSIELVAGSSRVVPVIPTALILFTFSLPQLLFVPCPVHIALTNLREASPLLSHLFSPPTIDQPSKGVRSHDDSWRPFPPDNKPLPPPKSHKT